MSHTTAAIIEEALAAGRSAVIKLKPEIKASWLAALRSGVYKQETNVLRYADGFCCLGVLCDLAGPELNLHWSIGDESTYRLVLDEYNTERNHLPLIIQQWAGGLAERPIVEVTPTLRAHPRGESLWRATADTAHRYTTLDSLNDSGFTFAEIADIIEEQL